MTLAVLVARDEGLFHEEGLDVEIIDTPGTSLATADHQAMREGIFDRTMEARYNSGAVDQYRMCEWGVMKRTVEAVEAGQRPAKSVASALSSRATRPAAKRPTTKWTVRHSPPCSGRKRGPRS